jgi:hypothetical protein
VLRALDSAANRRWISHEVALEKEMRKAFRVLTNERDREV